ncbi:MAG TPA: Clp protease N-terminal domain-containing protein, partial [Solirubrobacteraceae bacterium]|nr:Clp protease N-terminal domain-containing protein [Solirubrobacteraceae bacterium]
MFERFTERARQVVVLAQEEARTLKHSYIGTEHILLGLLREDEGLAARVLESFDITLQRVRGQVVRIVGSGEEVASGQIPFTPRAKKVLQLALREALALGHDYIGTEHILLGLVRENEGVAMRILIDFGADSESVRNEVWRMLGAPRGASAGELVEPSRGPLHTEFSRRPLEQVIGRFTDRAKATVAIAQREALALDHDRVDSEHLLLALTCQEDGVAATVLASLNVTSDRVRELIESRATTDTELPSANSTFTIQAATVLDHSLRAALGLGHNHIETEHILLSLIRERDAPSPAIGILSQLGADREKVRDELKRVLGVSQLEPRGLGRPTARFALARGPLDWRRATLMWRPEGLEIRIPQRLADGAMATFAADEVWTNSMLSPLRREIWRGWLGLASPT